MTISLTWSDAALFFFILILAGVAIYHYATQKARYRCAQLLFSQARKMLKERPFEANELLAVLPMLLGHKNFFSFSKDFNYDTLRKDTDILMAQRKAEEGELRFANKEFVRSRECFNFATSLARTHLHLLLEEWKKSYARANAMCHFTEAEALLSQGKAPEAEQELLRAEKLADEGQYAMPGYEKLSKDVHLALAKHAINEARDTMEVFAKQIATAKNEALLGKTAEFDTTIKRYQEMYDENFSSYVVSYLP